MKNGHAAPWGAAWPWKAIRFFSEKTGARADRRRLPAAALPASGSKGGVSADSFFPKGISCQRPCFLSVGRSLGARSGLSMPRAATDEENGANGGKEKGDGSGLGNGDENLDVIEEGTPRDIAEKGNTR